MLAPSVCIFVIHCVVHSIGRCVYILLPVKGDGPTLAWAEIAVKKRTAALGR